MPDVETREAQFNRLYELHLEAVRAYAWRRAPGLADDVVAETFLVAWRRLDDVPADDALPWLIGVAIDRGQVARALGCSRANVSVRLLRARRRLESALADAELGSPAHISGGAFDARS